MPIPKNINKEHIIEAIQKISREGVPERRESTRFSILYEGKHYPPKYVISIANIFANGEEHSPSKFSGGKESNSFLNTLGFRIVENQVKDLNDEQKNTWIFQGNPKVFDIDNYVKNHKYIWWSLRQEYYQDKIEIGDEVFLWRSDGGRRGTGGILAKAKVVSLPQEETDDENAEDYWHTDDGANSYLAIKLEVLDVRLGEGFISRLSLLEHPVLKNLLILRLRQQTNYLLSVEHANEINKLWSLKIIKEIEKDIEAEFAEEDYYYTDGKVKEFFGKRYERNIENRKKAIEIHGLSCAACGFNFEEVYGERGKDFIEVHHVKPLSTLKEEMVIDAKEDLVPVCANCHRMIHRRKENVLTVEELKTLLRVKDTN